jgi:hypothetical protein
MMARDHSLVSFYQANPARPVFGTKARPATHVKPSSRSLFLAALSAGLAVAAFGAAAVYFLSIQGVI